MSDSIIKEITKGLNPQQKEAVTKSFKQPTLVIAGAGSGKTRVLTKRVTLLLAKGVSPRKLLTVTFTNKAAKEMKERIEQSVGTEKASKILIGTFHSLAVRWLHQFYKEAGLKKNWTIFDDDDTNNILKKVLKDFGIDNSKQNLLYYKSRISNLKNAMINPEDFRQTMGREDKEFYEVYAKYQDALKRQNGVDFDDLIMKMVHLLENNPLIRAKFQKRFKYVMCDEFQDTNECQYRMIINIVGNDNNLFVVGDDAQSIYKWRGADVTKILNLHKDFPNLKTIKLEQNYRSTQLIVKAGNEIIKHNQNQLEKTCFSTNSKGNKIKVYEAPDDIAEAQFIAEEIQNLCLFNGFKYKDIAILYRTNVQSRLLEDQFLRHNIPYHMHSGFSFYERKEVKDILSWIQIAVNPDNDLACNRILNMQKGIGKTTIASFYEEQRNSKEKSLYDIVQNASPKRTQTAAALASLTYTVSKLNAIYEAGKHASDTPISDMFELVLKYTNYIENLKADGTEESLRRIDNILELQKIAKGYEEENDNVTVQDFLDQIALQSRQDDINDDNKVQMMTIHTSKGLEFEVVFLIGMEEGLFPHANSMHDYVQLEEERRLAYVGVTRAKQELYLTYAQRRMDWHRNWSWQQRSRFVDEIPQELKEEI